MRTKNLVRLVIGTETVDLEGTDYALETNKLVLSVRPTKREQCRCGVCHRKASFYDAGHGRRQWQRVDVVVEFMRLNWRTMGGICNWVYKDHGLF